MPRTRTHLASLAAVAALAVAFGVLLVCPPSLIAGEGFKLPEAAYDSNLGTWEGVWAIKNVKVVSMVPGGKRLARKQTVIVRDGYIEEIGKTRRVEIPEGARVINAKRKFLIPGLIDSHAHLWMGDRRFRDFDEKDLWTLYLANGITTVYELIGADLNNNIRSFLFGWRDQIARGEVVGPEFFIASPRFRDDLQRNFVEIDAAVERYAEVGFDSIKVHAPNSLPNYLRLFEQARRRGIKPIGHPPYRSPDVSVDVVLENQTMVSHTQLLMYQFNRKVGNVNMTPRQMEELAEKVREAGTIIQPTVATSRILYFHRLDEVWDDLVRSLWLDYFPADVRRSWIHDNEIRQNSGSLDGSKFFWESLLEMTRVLHAAGVPMIAGSDAGGLDMTPHGFFFHEELKSLNREVGMSTWETLETATRNNAIFIEREDLVGTVEVGKRADLVLLDRNPLKNIRNVGKIAGVMTRGHWLPRSELDGALEDLRLRMAEAGSTRSTSAPTIDRDVECHGPAVRRGVDLVPSAGLAPTPPAPAGS